MVAMVTAPLKAAVRLRASEVHAVIQSGVIHISSIMGTIVDRTVSFTQIQTRTDTHGLVNTAE